MKGSLTTAFRIISALALLCAACYGTVYAFNAAVASAIYHKAKYGADKDAPERILARCEEAGAYYPWNYYFVIWTAESAYYSSFGLSGAEAEKRLAEAARWCDAGLALNRHKSQLRLLKTRLIERRSGAEAIRYWKEFVDWDFWQPYHHAVLAELLARAGDFESAFDELQWVTNLDERAAAAGKVKDAWNKDMARPAPK